jgi:hypothetical protein
MRKMKPSDKKVVVGFSLSPTALGIMDKEGGKESRSSFVDRLIKKCGQTS